MFGGGADFPVRDGAKHFEENLVDLGVFVICSDETYLNNLTFYII